MGRAKSMRIIGDPHKWSSAGQQTTERHCIGQTEDSEPHRAESGSCDSRAGRAANMIEILRNKSRKAEINELKCVTTKY